MSSTQVNQRELYMLTRSEATALVAMYMNAKKKGADGSIEPERVFRDELETAKPAYLGRFNNSHNAVVQGTFYRITLNLYKTLEELNYRVSETNYREKTMDAAKLLPCKHSIAYLTATFLGWAIYNWYMKTEPVVEDLGDNGYEFNSCAVCDYTGQNWFFFSTAYGLDNPICENCLPVNGDEYEEYEEGEYEEYEEEGEYEEYEEEGEYEEEDLTKLSGQQLRDIWCVLIGKPTGIACSGKLRTKKMLIDEIIRLRESAEASEAEASEAEASEAEASEAEASDDDEDYEPSNDSEAEKEEDDIDDEINSEEEDEDTVEVEDTDEEEEKSFGCTGCPYEWRAGFKHGYKTAMKEMRNYANRQKHNIPEAPVCDVCGDSHENLKKCGKCRAVRYCSEECQTEDWVQHKHVCRKE